MDIQVVGQENPEWKPGFSIIYRTFDGIDAPFLLPSETLSLRAAEYDLDTEDPIALEILMLEGFYNSNPNDPHPLHTSDTIADARKEMERRLEVVREENGSPTDPKARLLSVAVENERCTYGLIGTHAMLHNDCNPEVMEPVKFFRDQIRYEARKSMYQPRVPLHTQLLSQMNAFKATGKG